MRRCLTAAARIVITVATLVLGTVILAAPSFGAASTVVNPDYTRPAPTTVVVNPAPPAAASSPGPRAGDAPLRLRLPITGTDVAVLAAAGAALVTVGLVGRRAAGRRPL